MAIYASVPDGEELASKLSVAEMLDVLGICEKDITRNTYLYINLAGDLVACEKGLRDTYPSDEASPIGYAFKEEGGARGMKEQLRTLRHGGSREGAGRPPGPPQLNIRIAATPEEKEAILAGTTPRQRAEALLKAAKEAGSE